ncbi:hypothetical protein LX32DRAFT_716188 [Colletotrichum zoysiae]|uniref:Uncharacterized protein n=1 Tax=Colletotrichum zoysiae TaxID=1216348 RepID=A0AAD9HMJ9_9PEZI|nr:hypothetical protein LX32DRAFT_716188 [Colletotrichum zoysiae]
MADTEQTHFYVTVNSVDDEGWIVDVSENRQRAILQGVRVTDPLTPGQRATCRWYIEQYVQKSPFSAEKALEAENMMCVYPEKLLASLPLREIFLLPHDPKRRSAGPKFFYLIICQDAGQCRPTWPSSSWGEAAPETLSPSVVRSFVSTQTDRPRYGLRRIVHLPRHQSRSWSVTSLHLDSFDLTLIDEIIVDIVSKINCVIIIEGLDQLPIDPIPSVLSLPATMEVLIKTLLRMAGNLSRIQKCYLIFTQRMADPRGVESLVSHRFGPHCFDLKGLDLPDAIQLSHQILQSNGNDIQQWKYEDAD